MSRIQGWGQGTAPYCGLYRSKTDHRRPQTAVDTPYENLVPWTLEPGGLPARGVKSRVSWRSCTLCLMAMSSV